MRHGNVNRKFGLERAQRKALFKSLANSLFINGKIETTVEKAKELRPFVERMVTKAKMSGIASRRAVAKQIGSGTGLSKLFGEIAPKLKNRNGGYTRIIKIWRKSADGSKKAMIEFLNS